MLSKLHFETILNRKRSQRTGTRRHFRKLESLEARVVLAATPISEAAVMQSTVQNEQVVSPIAFYFIADADTNETLAELTSGSTIDPSLVAGRKVTLYALANQDDASGVLITSTVVSLDSGPSNTESVSPYTLFGDNNGDFKKGVDLADGPHLFRAIFYSGNNAGGDLLADVQLDFSVDDSVSNRLPVATDDTAFTDEDVPVNIDVLGNDSDPDGDVVTVGSVDPAANGSTSIAADGSVLYTPNANYFGADSFTYTLADGQGGSATATVNVDVAAINDPPSVSDLTVTIEEDSGSFAVTVSGSDFGSDVESETIYFLDAEGEVGGEVTLAGEASILFYTPDPNFNRTEFITVTLWDQLDASSTSTATLTIQVTPVNDTPVAGDDLTATGQDTAVLIDVMANDSDVDGDTLSIISVSDPANGTAAVIDGEIRYRPADGFFGSDSFSYAISDGAGGEATATVSVDVSEATQELSIAQFFLADVATDQTLLEITPGTIIDLSLVEGREVTIYAIADQGDPDGANVASVVVSLDGGPSNTENVSPYTLFGDSNGDFNRGVSLAAGFHVFSAVFYSGNNASGDLLADVPINFEVGQALPNQPPTAVDDVATTDEGVAVIVDVLGNDADVDGDELVVIEAGPAAFGSISIVPGGVEYLPDVGFVGTDTFSYTVSDPDGATATALAEVTVTESGSVGVVSGELKKWHKVTINFPGPSVGENDSSNPFLNYRLDVTFTHQSTGEQKTVPGFFAADGDAANTSASEGNIWRVHFSPDQTGPWTYEASFRTGNNVAISSDPLAGTATAFDGDTGSFSITDTDKSGRDLRGKGQLQYVGERYLQFAETGEYFLKQGADSPENLLAYEDFDNTTDVGGRLKSWAPHQQDYRLGDPSWQGGKGTELIGAINYLASEGMNAYSFIPMTFAGDDKNVFPWISTDSSDRTRFDVSKLSQWEILFEHGDQMGMFQHFKTQETENELLLDGGDLGPERILYYRELIARFSHHLALNWNLGEEINNATTAQKQAWAQYFADTDPYNHHIVIHNGANHFDLLGDNSALTGFSLQTNRSDFANVHNRVKDYLQRSEDAGKIWAVATDEPGDASAALRPDSNPGNSQIDARKNALWGTFLAGGWGNEWYFGYQYENSDLTLEDFRSRDQWWDTARYALEFFDNNEVPFWEMSNDNEISSASNDYGFIKEGEVYVVYLKDGGTTDLDLSAASGDFTVQWYNPRSGGDLQQGTVADVGGGGPVNLGLAPEQTNQDWVILVTSDNINRRPVVDDSVADLEVAENASPVTIDLATVFSDNEDTVLAYQANSSDPSVVAVAVDVSTVTLNFAADTVGQATVTLTATDSGGKSVSDDFLVTLGDFNAPPTDLSLSNRTVEENSADGTLVGTLTVTDPDDTSHSFVLTDDAGGRFDVTSGGDIVVADGVLLDFESATSHEIIVQVSDGSNSYSEPFTIAVSNVLDGPSEPGLVGTYFDSIDLTDPVTVQVDPTVDFDGDELGNDALGRVAADDQYSIRWEGFVLAPEAGTWQFTTFSNDGVRLWVGDVGDGDSPIINNWDQHTSTRDDATITLAAGWHPIRLEYFQQNGTTDMRLLFSGPGQSESIIPSSSLATADTSALTSSQSDPLVTSQLLTTESINETGTSDSEQTSRQLQAEADETSQTSSSPATVRREIALREILLDPIDAGQPAEPEGLDELVGVLAEPMDDMAGGVDAVFGVMN